MAAMELAERAEQTPLIPAQSGIQACHARRWASLDPRLRACEKIGSGDVAGCDSLSPRSEVIRWLTKRGSSGQIETKRGLR